jgi:hypothetical protein
MSPGWQGRSAPLRALAELLTKGPEAASEIEANGYKPDFDKFPSEAEYRAAEDKKEDDAKRP